ncbi:MAG: GNAT family N-acetyltransferase [Geobacteraceae bacterium]|nr:GNAT family N-acetyltransferase [Geobacteraceae bacterium]
MPDIRINRFQAVHIPQFQAMAEQEGWACDCREFDFTFKVFPQGAYVALSDGIAVAFVTAVRHHRSGWIGNLLVHHKHRGKGLGRKMFNRALASLEVAGVETAWLTASESGRPIYESAGFRAVDTIGRWRVRGVCARAREILQDGELDIVEELDREGWGDNRALLLKAVTANNSVLVQNDGFLAIQQMGSGSLLGPWSSRTPAAAEFLLAKAFEPGSSSPGLVVLDCPGSNYPASRMLSAAGFSPVKSTVLMYRGKTPDYRPDSIFALASMGSMG